MTVTEKTKTIDNKIEQNKTQECLGRQITTISALSSGNVGKYEFLIVWDILWEKYWLGKAATIKIFEYLLIGSELKKQTDFAKSQCQGLNKVYIFDKKTDLKKIQAKIKKLTKKDKKCFDINYDKIFNWNKHKNDKHYNIDSFSSKFDYLKEIHDKLEKFLKYELCKQKCRSKKISVR